MLVQMRIRPGTRIAWYVEERHQKALTIERGTVLINGEETGGRGFWVACDDGRRQLIQRQWLVDDEDILRLNPLPEGQNHEVPLQGRWVQTPVDYSLYP
jgi:hypothetical protein